MGLNAKGVKALLGGGITDLERVGVASICCCALTTAPTKAKGGRGRRSQLRCWRLMGEQSVTRTSTKLPQRATTSLNKGKDW